MTLRTFKQFAQGFGATTTQVSVALDANTIYSGSVNTLDQPLPSPGLSNIDNLAWTWQDEIDAPQTRNISITVTGSPLVLASTLTQNLVGNTDAWMSFFFETIDGVTYHDCFTNEAIDGVAQNVPKQPGLTGQWWWIIPAGSVFTATMHISLEPVQPTEP